jgi:prepilin-type N-terminal cleavage/methylation domain-containing protein
VGDLTKGFLLRCEISEMNKGFTLIELLIVVGIMGVLAAIGVPQYLKYADSSRTTVVKDNLRTIYLQQQEYYQKNNAYYKTGASCNDAASSINTNLFNGKTIIVNDKFTYCITQSTVDDFIAKATEMSGGSGRTYTINQLNQTNF